MHYLPHLSKTGIRLCKLVRHTGPVIIAVYARCPPPSDYSLDSICQMHDRLRAQEALCRLFVFMRTRASILCLALKPVP